MLPNEILAGRYNTGLARRFNIQGEPPTPQLGAEVVPVSEVEPFGAEGHWSVGTRICSGAHTIAAVAAKVGAARLRNPANSGMLVIVERIVAGSYAAIVDDLIAGVVYINTDLAQLPAAGTVAVRDTRAGAITAAPSAKYTFDQSPPGLAAGNVFRVPVLQYTAYVHTSEIVLAPGTALDIYNATNNVILLVSLAWRERPVFAMELAS